MYKQTIIAEIKDQYAYALGSDMELIKIKKKEHMAVGQEIYITKEDIYEEKIIPIEPHAEMKKSSVSKKIYKKLAIACAFILAFVGILNSFSSVGYANSYISLELKEPRQILIDKAGIIKEITDKKFNPVETKLKGKKLTDNLNVIIKDNMPSEGENFIMVCDKAPEELTVKLKTELENLGYEGDLLIIKGQKDAWKNAKSKRKSLSRYVIEENGIKIWNKKQNQNINSDEKQKMLKKFGTYMEVKRKQGIEEYKPQEDKKIELKAKKFNQSHNQSPNGTKKQTQKGKSQNN